MSEISPKVQAALKQVVQKASEPTLAISLPEFQEVPREEFPISSTWMLIGHGGTGKSKLAEHLSRLLIQMTGKPLIHLDLENGAHHTAGAKIAITNFEQMNRTMQALENGGMDRYSGAILDTADMLNEWCEQRAAAELKCQVMGEAGYGADWAKARIHFMNYVMRFKAMHKTLLITCHTKVDKQNKDVSQTRPNLPAGLSEVILGQVDSAAYLSIEKVKGTRKAGQETPDSYNRILSFAGHEGLCAKSRYSTLSGHQFHLQDLSMWPQGNLWSPVLDAFKIQEEVNGELASEAVI